jgi:hypothetical protein
MSDFPPSSDVVELLPTPHGGIQLFCLICGKQIGRPVRYLNEALVVWRDHRAERREHVT